MKKPPASTANKRTKLAAWLAEAKPECIDAHEFDALLATLAPISESYLRKLLRESGTPLAPVVEGVRQSTLDDLESSLQAMLEEYQQGDSKQARKLVITAKDHARWAARNPEKREQKEEMILWMLTWLENPPLFPAWLKLRRARYAALKMS
jgi:hypothetical protein